MADFDNLIAAQDLLFAAGRRVEIAVERERFRDYDAERETNSPFQIFVPGHTSATITVDGVAHPVTLDLLALPPERIVEHLTAAPPRGWFSVHPFGGTIHTAPVTPSRRMRPS